MATLVKGSWRILAKEIAAFGAVGFVSLLLDLAIYNALLHDDFGPLKAKLVSTVVSTTAAYIGNRYLSFSHRARTSIRRETGYFFGINLITLGFSEAVLAIFAYPLDYRHDKLVMNVVNLFTIAIGSVFRFWAYKRFVFLHPDHALAEVTGEDPFLAAN
jgi:putative flippase GtrA